MRGIYNTFSVKICHDCKPSFKKEGYKPPWKESVKKKADLVELAFNAHLMKLAKVSEGESKNENRIMAKLLATDIGVLPDTGSILKSNWSRNLSIFPEVTFPDDVTIFWERPTSTLKKP